MILATFFAFAALAFAQFNIVAAGDSLTWGYPDSIGANSYPSQLGQLFPGSTVTDLGVGGANSDQVLTDQAWKADDAFSPAMQNIFLLWVGYNGFDQPDVAARLRTNVQSIIAGRKAIGFRTVVLTLTPSEYALQGPGFDEFRDSYNSWLDSGASGADLVCDSGDDPRLAQTVPPFFAPDHLHLETPGYGIIANDVALCLTLGEFTLRRYFFAMRHHGPHRALRPMFLRD